MKNKLIVNLSYFLLFLYVILVYIFSGQKEYTFTYKIPMILFISLQLIDVFINKKISIPQNIKILYVFCIFLFVSNFWAIDSNSAITIAKTVFLLITFCLFGYNFLNKEQEGFIKYLKLLIWAGMAFSIYLISYYGINNYIELIKNGMRVGNEIDNVNKIGLECAITYILTLFLGINYKKFYLYLIPIPLITALGTGSKKVLIILVIGTIMMLMFKSENQKKTGLAKKIISILAIFIVIYFVATSFSNISIINRLERYLNNFSGSGKTDYSTIERKLFIEYGIQQFKDTPFLGLGAGNSGYITMKAVGKQTYLHNNYIELLATTGIVGFFLYYSNFIVLLKDLFKNNSKDKSTKNVKAFSIIIIIMILLLDYGMVSYDNKIIYLYFIVPLLSRNWRNKNNEENY